VAGVVVQTEPTALLTDGRVGLDVVPMPMPVRGCLVVAAVAGAAVLGRVTDAVD